MYVQRWLSLLKVERTFFLLFEDFTKNKKAPLSFTFYYNSFINAPWPVDLEFQIYEAFEHHRTSQPYYTLNNKLVFIEPDINLLEVNKYLLFTLLELFKRHLEMCI